MSPVYIRENSFIMVNCCISIDVISCTHGNVYLLFCIVSSIMSWLFSILLRTVNNTKTQGNVSVRMGPWLNQGLPLYLINFTYRVLIFPLLSPTGIFSYFPYVPLLYTKSPHAFTYSIAPDGDLLAGYSTFRSKQQMYLDSLLIFDPIIYRTTNTKLVLINTVCFSSTL